MSFHNRSDRQLSQFVEVFVARVGIDWLSGRQNERVQPVGVEDVSMKVLLVAVGVGHEEFDRVLERRDVYDSEPTASILNLELNGVNRVANDFAQIDARSSSDRRIKVYRQCVRPILVCFALECVFDNSDAIFELLKVTSLVESCCCNVVLCD